mgnify:CR=1 FL=1
MKRCQVHLHVEDLARSMSFYSKLFAAEPARVESDCAKWMLEEPRVNFAISTSGRQAGIGHLGVQTDDAAELAELKVRSETADMALLDEGETTCCYARSEKHWVTDPQGIAWEHFHTLGDIPVFNEGQKAEAARLGRDVQAHSAGSVPSGRINPIALEVLADAGVDTRGCRSKSWDEISRDGAPPPSIVITVCGSAAAEACPVFFGGTGGQPVKVHWGHPDASNAEGRDAGKRRAFELTRQAIGYRMLQLLALPLERMDRNALQAALSAIGKS